MWATPFGGDRWQDLASARAAHAAGFAAYMDAIARDAGGAPWKVAPGEFLGQGIDPGGKADYQGCSEFNPVLRLSIGDEQALAKPGRKEERNRRNASNRRVLVFLWPPGRKVDPAGWPCPRVKESTAGCRAQFWPDGDARRGATQTQREYAKGGDTFACRWYDELARESPCEAARKRLQIRLFDREEKEMPNAPYRLTIGSVEVREKKADEHGLLTEDNVLAVREVTLEWGDEADGFPFKNTIRLDYTHGDGNEPWARRLSNLGYYESDFSANMKSFMSDYDIPDDTGDDKAKEHLEDVHDNQLSKVEFKRKNNLS